MPIITLPDGSKKVFEKSVTILEIAQSIGAGLAKATIAGKVNDVLLDATIPINKDSKVVIITSKDKEGNKKAEDLANKTLKGVKSKLGFFEMEK